MAPLLSSYRMQLPVHSPSGSTNRIFPTSRRFSRTWGLGCPDLLKVLTLSPTCHGSVLGWKAEVPMQQGTVCAYLAQCCDINNIVHVLLTVHAVWHQPSSTIRTLPYPPSCVVARVSCTAHECIAGSMLAAAASTMHCCHHPQVTLQLH